MVSPEGTGAEPDRPRSGRGLLLAVVGLAIAAGFVALGALSPAEEAAVETTTTSLATATTTVELAPPFDPENFEVSQIETGPQFDWTKTLTLEDGYPLGLIEHRGSLYLFVSEGRFWIGEPDDVTIWELDGSGSWQNRGSAVGSEHSVIAMTGHGDDVILVGSASGGGSVSVWRSRDLASWTRDDIPLHAQGATQQVSQVTVGSDGHLVVVSAWLSLDSRIVMDALRDAGYDVDFDYGWGLEDDAVVVYGPFGVTVERVSYTELGWDEDTQSSLVSAYQEPSQTKTWTQLDDGEWQQVEIPGMLGVEAITPYPGGGVVATGWGQSERLSAFSTDGVKWFMLSEGATATWGMKPWGDLLVGPTDRSVPGLAVSADGSTWEVFGPDDRFPEDIHWSTDALAASSEGVIFTTGGVSPGLPLTPPSERTSPSRIDLDNDATLVVDFETGRIDLETESGIFSWQMYSPNDQDGISGDLSERTLTFRNPETEEVLATVGFDVLEKAQESFSMDRFPDAGHRALVFTPDGETWTIQDAAAEFGESSMVRFLVIGDGHVAVIAYPDWWWDNHPYEVWTAPLP